MSPRQIKWTGGILAAGTVASMIFYFATVGLTKSDQLSSVIGLFVALTGLALTGYGASRERDRTSASRRARSPEPSRGPGNRKTTINGGVNVSGERNSTQVGEYNIHIGNAESVHNSDTAN